MPFKVRDLMVNVLPAGAKGAKPPGGQTKCANPTCKNPPQCMPPTNTGIPGVYDPQAGAHDLELLRGQLRAALESPPGTR